MYYLLLILLYPVALLPLRVLYVLSDLIFLILFYIVGYRKALVLEQLQYAFPEKSADELLRIRRQFFRNFCDQWMETLKLLTISEAQLNKRITANWEVFHQLYDDGKDTYALLGHTFNWEWANVACQYNCRQQFAGVYMPPDNKAFDKLMQRIRTRSGVWLISMMAKKGFARLQGVRYIVGLIADQNPSNLKAAVWLNFMHRTVPFFRGPEQLATRNKAAVVFAGIERLKRGYYKITLHKYTDDASQLPQGQMMQDYVSFMEEQLHHQPDNWMWTHRRWKHSDKAISVHSH